MKIASFMASGGILLASGFFAIAAAQSRPVALWSAESDYLDSVGTNHGTMGIGVSLVSEVGRTGQVFSFDGSLSSGILIPDSSCLRFSDSFTLAAWIKTSAIGTQTGPDSFADIIRKRHRDAGGLMDIGLGMVNGRARFFLRDDAGVTDTSGGIVSTSIVNDDEWHHITAVRDSGDNTMKLFVDGVLEASCPTTTGTFSEVNGNPWVIGNSGGTTEFPWEGLIDDVAVFKGALSSQEILDIANDVTNSSTWVRPWVSLSRENDGTLRIYFVGILESSRDLTAASWSVVDPQPCSPYTILQTPGVTSKFYRARKP